jgi:hypothetical protein
MASAVAYSPKDLLQEAWDRVVSGRYVVLSWKALESLVRKDNDTEFHLTAELVAQCSFIRREDFSLKDSQAFVAAVQAPRGIEQGTTGRDKRYGLIENIKLAPFLKKEAFLTDDARVLISNDLIEDLSGSCMTSALLRKCVFVSKQVFDGSIKKKFAFDVNSGEPMVKNVAGFSSAIESLRVLRAANEPEPDDAEAMDIMYTILVRPPV